MSDRSFKDPKQPEGESRAPASRGTPGKSASTSRLSSPAGRAVQRQGQAGGSSRNWTTDPRIEAAICGTPMPDEDVGEAVQAKGGGGEDPAGVHQAAAEGISGSGGALPHLDRIQQSFGGHDVGSIQAHVGGPAAEASARMGATAYATGDHVAFGGTPDLHTTAHEAAHVVQQRQGVQLQGGVGQTGDAYERQADAVADAVVQGRPAEGLLGAAASSGGGAAVQGKAVQRADGDPAAGTGGTGLAPVGGGTPGADGATPGADGATPAEEPADPYAAFVRAVNAFDTADIHAKWAACGAGDKQKLGPDGPVQRRLMFQLKKDSVPFLKQGGVDWSDTATAYSVFLMDDFDLWYDALWGESMYLRFLAAEPRKASLTQAHAKKLQGWMAKVPGPTNAELLFEKVYPSLNDTSLYPDWQRVAPWTVDRVQRLYNALSDHVPVGHVQTITGGFTLIDTTKKKVNNAWQWVPLRFAWWEPSNFRVVLNATSTGANEGGTGHDMTGGLGAGAAAGYTLDDGSAGTQTSLTHFRGSALHEVGHGVGQRMGGDAYAMNASNYPQWTPLSPEQWANELWIDGATSGSAPAGLDDDAELDEDDAKDFLLTEIRDGQDSWSKWNNGASRNEIVQYLGAVYSNQPLYRMWTHVIVNNVAKDNFYSVNDPARTQGAWTYGIFTRWHESNYAKLSSAAFAGKVSWYSVSSPKEWFAEQYTHYYRTEKTGGGLIDAATKALLDRLDQQQFVPTSADGQRGVVIPDGSPGSSGAGDRAADAGGSTGAEDVYPGGPTEPCLFPW